MFLQIYKNTMIERNTRGYYTAFLSYAGCYIQCDTLASCKKMITADIAAAKNLECQYK